MSQIIIIDYGMGNLGSIRNMFKRIGFKAIATNDLNLIEQAEKLILPGVGAFDTAMERINTNSLRLILDYKVMVEKIPILGICLGMQLLTNRSEEGLHPGLGWIQGSCYRFPEQNNLKVPHMGWNIVTATKSSPLTQGLPEESRFYFVHSYYVKTEKRENSILNARYGISFDAAIQKDNIYGTQFHPEKSHSFGMKLFENFARL